MVYFLIIDLSRLLHHLFALQEFTSLHFSTLSIAVLRLLCAL